MILESKKYLKKKRVFDIYQIQHIFTAVLIKKLRILPIIEGIKCFPVVL